MSENYIQENIGKIGEEMLKKLNMYTVLQILWLIEMYYLGINSIYNKVIKMDIMVKAQIPTIVLRYNKLVLQYFEKWSGFVVFIGIGLFICAFSIVFIKLIPKISDYKLLYCYSSYGATASIWLLLIYLTYRIYLFTGVIFLLTPILVFTFIELLKKILKKLNEKFNFGVFE